MIVTKNINISYHIYIIYNVAGSKKIIAFDIGIKNMAFCVVQEDKHVVALENCNLLDPVESITCHQCAAKASLQAGIHPCCKRHIPKEYKTIPELSGKKLPVVKVLKDLIQQHNCEKAGPSKDKCIESLSKVFALPFEQPKQPNAAKVSLETIHDALRTFVEEKAPLLDGCTHVLLENQPAFKNPHMKSVQVLLFATLREFYLRNHQTPSYHFIHAKKKVGDSPKGDEGYSERKNKSEERVRGMFDKGEIRNTELYTSWQQAKKKSDMADALCMCIDFLPSTKNESP